MISAIYKPPYLLSTEDIECVVRHYPDGYGTFIEPPIGNYDGGIMYLGMSLRV